MDGRACPGHPRLATRHVRDVDARDKPGMTNTLVPAIFSALEKVTTAGPPAPSRRLVCAAGCVNDYTRRPLEPVPVSGHISVPGTESRQL